MREGKWVFCLEYQLLAVNELQSGIILHVFHKHLAAKKLGFAWSGSDKSFKLSVFPAAKLDVFINSRKKLEVSIESLILLMLLPENRQEGTLQRVHFWGAAGGKNLFS